MIKMHKTIVETKTSVMLLDRGTGCEIPAHRPAVVFHTAFIDRFIANGTLKVLAGDLPEDASDADFAEIFKEQPDIAVEAYVSELSGDEPEAPATEPAATSESAKPTEGDAASEEAAPAPAKAAKGSKKKS